MPYELIVGWAVIGFGFVLVAGTWLGTDTHTIFGGLFPSHGARDWPTGVQEPDAPRFAVAHLDGLRPRADAPIVERPVDASNDPTPEVIDLGQRHLDRTR